MSTKNNNNEAATEAYDRRKELEEFDNTKLGVKGLVDSGITRVPTIFHHPPETLFTFQHAVSTDDKNCIPVIDMSIPHQNLVQNFQKASAKFGFFQVINHGIPVTLLDRLVKAIKAFHELPPAEKMPWYDRSIEKSVTFKSNHDLFYSRAASWRDTIVCRLGAGLDAYIDPDLVPYVCRDEVVEYEKEVKKVGERVTGLLSEGLGLSRDRMTGVEYIGKVTMVANYYPHCPEPTKTVGIASHTDMGMLTILLQDQVGGLQVKCNGEWIDLKPVNGALVINVGDVFQIVSNDEYKSGQHRVLANRFVEARASIAVFLDPGTPENMYGPLPELVSDEKPALFKQFKFSELSGKYFSKELDSTMVDHYRL